MNEGPSTVQVAQDLWASVNEEFTDEDAVRRWADDGIGWGLFGVPERELGVLGDVSGARVVELGCGTAYLSAQLARLGARPVAVDLSPHQLRTATGCQRRFGVHFPLVEASAEAVPLRASSADLVVSEYGAGPWCRPRRWLAEASRLLRPGGRLVFLTSSVLAALCVPDTGGFAGTELQRPQRALRRVEWPGGGTEYHPGHGEWIAELRAAGFLVDALHELYPPSGATTPPYYEIVTVDWAQRWPAEDLWVAHLLDGAHHGEVATIEERPAVAAGNSPSSSRSTGDTTMPIDTFFVFVGTYADLASAEADYAAVKSLHTDAELIDAYDAAVVHRREDGKVKIVKHHETPTRVGGVLGGGVGLATGLVIALFPAAAIGTGLLAGATAGGAALGALAGHATAGLSRKDLKELGEELDRGSAGLVVVGVSDMASKIEAEMAKAEKVEKRELQADTEELGTPAGSG